MFMLSSVAAEMFSLVGDNHAELMLYGVVGREVNRRMS